jgi:hypothetical protein
MCRGGQARGAPASCGGCPPRPNRRHRRRRRRRPGAPGQVAARRRGSRRGASASSGRARRRRRAAAWAWTEASPRLARTTTTRRRGLGWVRSSLRAESRFLLNSGGGGAVVVHWCRRGAEGSSCGLVKHGGDRGVTDEAVADRWVPRLLDPRTSGIDWEKRWMMLSLVECELGTTFTECDFAREQTDSNFLNVYGSRV